MINKMSTLDRVRLAGRILLNRQKPRRKIVRPSAEKQFPIYWPTFRDNEVQWHLVDYETFAKEGYAGNSIIYSAIAYKWRQVANAPLMAFDRGENNSLEPINDSDPLAQLLRNPNSSMTGTEMSQMIVMYLNIDGNSYTVISRDTSGNPAGLYPLRPDRVYIVRFKNEEGELAISYWYRPDGAGINFQDMVPILNEDMIHNKFPNPLDDLEGFGYGLSPLAPAAQSADVDNEITRFLKEFFEHGAVSPGYITFDSELEEDVAEEVADRFMEMHGGSENWTDVAVFERGGKFVPLTPAFKDMGFEMIDERNEARILGPLGVPPILIGSRSGTAVNAYGTATRQERLRFWEDTMIPELNQISGEFTKRLGGDDRVVAYNVLQVPALVDRNVERVDAFEKLVRAGTPRDDAYRVVGLPEIQTPHGDVSWMPSSMQPYTEDTELPEPTVSNGDNTGNETAMLDAPPTPKSLPAPEHELLLPADSLKLPEYIYDAALGLYNQECTSALKARRTFDWETLGINFMVQFNGDKHLALLIAFTEDGYTEGWNADKGRSNFVRLFS